MPAVGLKKHIRVFALAAAVCAALVLAAAGCRKGPSAGKSFRFPLQSEPRQIDPQVATDPSSIALISSLFEGLARIDETGTAKPAAASWTVSDNGLTYTFTLKSSKWSDGTEVTADDYVFGIQRAVHPSTKSKNAESLFIIKNAREINQGRLDVSKLGVKAADSKTLIVTLTQPDSDFPAKTATAPFMPCKKDFFEGTLGRYGIEAEYVLSNGPFYLKSWEHNKSVLLQKHEGYHDAEKILPASIRYVIGEVGDPVASLSEGSLDACPVPAEDLEKAKEKNITLITRQDTVRMLWMNNDIPALSSPHIRRALRDSIEWDALYRQLDSKTDIPAAGFVPPDSTAAPSVKYRSPGNALTPSTQSQKAAQAILKGLDAAGLEKMPLLTLMCQQDDYSLNIARYIIQSWQKNLSLYFKLEPLSRSELEARVKVGNYELALYSFTPSGYGALDVFQSFKSGAVGNLSHFSDKGFDSRLASVRPAPSKSDLEALEKMLWDSCPSVPVSFELTYVGIPKENSGIVVRPFGGGLYGSPYDFRQAAK
ncbi:MAG: peptide ABC transporter substrate-binding protein [Clostridiales bacterium]|jgi:oligopeptide transport system substrate-binding protein|nr:peptide ABC transporter substrate-binding protein [Clostridiales bacterium]